MSYIPEDSGVSFFDVAGTSYIESQQRPMLLLDDLDQQKQQARDHDDHEDDFEPAAEPSSTSSNVELYDSFEEAVWLESRTVAVLPERLAVDPILHSGAVSTAPSSRPHSPGMYKSQQPSESPSSKIGSARSACANQPTSFDAPDTKEDRPRSPYEQTNSWTPTPRKVEYHGTSRAMSHQLSKSERCPPKQRISHFLSSQEHQATSVKVLPTVRVIHAAASPSSPMAFSPRRITSPMLQWRSPQPLSPLKSPFLRPRTIQSYLPTARSQPMYVNWPPPYQRQVRHVYPSFGSTMTGYGKVSMTPTYMGNMTVNGVSPVILQPLPSSMLFYHA